MVAIESGLGNSLMMITSYDASRYSFQGLCAKEFPILCLMVGLFPNRPYAPVRFWQIEALRELVGSL